MHKSADFTRVMIVGNPNAGKSTLFNALTGGHAKVGNWHGVTVGVTERRAVLGDRAYLICDLPGIYAAESMTLEERAACAYLSDHTGILLLVAECARLERALRLFSVLAADRRCVLVLTKRRSFVRGGGRLDRAALERALGIPVLYAEGGGLRARVVQALSAARIWQWKGVLGTDRYTPCSAALSRMERLWLKPLFALPAFAAMLLLCFYLTFGAGMPGCLARDAIESLFSRVLAARAQTIPSPVLRSFVADGLLGGIGSVLGFLPQISMLFLFLILLEESGLISRLAWMTDGIFSRVGLNGRAVFSLLMGFGCTAAAILTTRGLEDRKMQRRVILCLPYISCSAKLPVFLTLAASFFRDPFPAVLVLYALGVCLALGMALLLRGKASPFLLELAPLALPSPRAVVKSLLFQIRQFIIKLATVILAFLLLSWLLSSFDVHGQLCAIEDSLLARICSAVRFLFAPIGMNDWRITYAALSGLVAKENVAGAIAMLCGEFPYPFASGAAFAVFLLAASPCVSAVAAVARELSVRFALLCSLAQTASALLLSYLVYFLLTGGAPLALIALAPVVALLLCIHGKKLSRRSADHIKTIHR